MNMMSPKEVSAFLFRHEVYVTADTVRAWASQGILDRTSRRQGKRKILKSRRIGGRILISKIAVERFIPGLVSVQE